MPSRAMVGLANPARSDETEPGETSAPRRKSKPAPASRPTHGSRYATMKDLELFSELMGELVGRTLEEKVEPRLKSLEENQVTFGGTWRDGESYPEKCIVTSGGSCWLSKMPNNTTKPGDGLAWRLIVKRGRDGRDSK